MISMDDRCDESYSKYQVVPKGGFSCVINNIKELKKIGGKCFLGRSLIIDNKKYLVHICIYIL